MTVGKLEVEKKKFNILLEIDQESADSWVMASQTCGAAVCGGFNFDVGVCKCTLPELLLKKSRTLPF